MDEILQGLRSIFKDVRIVIAILPAMIGLMPIMGGALVSAPMVDDGSDELKLSPERRTFINYWSRHPWEYMLPLYPGIVFASAVSAIPLSSLVIANAVYAVAMIVTGFIFSMRHIENGSAAEQGEAGKAEERQWSSFLPLMAILILVLA